MPVTGIELTLMSFLALIMQPVTFLEALQYAHSKKIILPDELLNRLKDAIDDDYGELSSY